MENEEKIIIIIDGSNFYHRLKELQFTNLLSFDYGKFSRFLAKERSLVSKIYCIGAIREEYNNERSKELMIGQQKLISKLRTDGWIVKLGHMLKSDGYHEKGVDVQMATDLLVGAYENFYDTAVLVSSDTDLIPALAKVRLMRKKIEYVGFSHKPSHGLIAHSDIRRLITKDEIDKFLK